MSSGTKLNLLLAYPYMNTARNVEYLRTQTNREDYNLIVDSGAFTAWNTGKPIHLDDYCRFLDSIADFRPFHAVTLDVVKNPEGSYKNFITMRSRGYDVLPVFTRGDSLERLEEYYSYSDYVLLGGLAGEGAAGYVKWFINNNKGRKAHLLGFVNLSFLQAYRPESVDSSSWTGAARFGGVHIYQGFGKIKTVTKQQLLKPPSDEFMRAMERIGVTYAQTKTLRKEVCWSSDWKFRGGDWTEPTAGIACFITTLSHLVRSYDVEKKLGTKLYLAGNVINVNQTLFSGLKYLKDHGIWK